MLSLNAKCFRVSWKLNYFLKERLLKSAGLVAQEFHPSLQQLDIGTEVAEEKETREIDGRMCSIEPSLKADFAYVKAWKGDKYGNLIFKGTARNFNPVMAMAGKITIAEVEELVEPGELRPQLYSYSWHFCPAHF